MGCINGEGISLCGNFAKLSKQRPKNWIDKEYKILIEYPFKWRVSIGKVKCNCKKIEEHYRSYYGYSFFHNTGCAYISAFKKRPQLLNLYQYQEQDINLICSSDGNEE